MEANFNESNLKFYSIGIVVYDKIENSDIISVIPIESLSGADKDLKSKSLEGIHKGTKVYKHNTILAKWFPDGNDNRITPPDVYANESVKIFRYADEDKYYWTTLFYEKNLRRLEHVRYSFSNQRKGTFNEVDDNSSYYVEYSTRKKHIHIHTSTNDGEASGYDIKINTATGELSIIDTQNNQLLWQSTQKKLTVKNFNEIEVDTNDQITVTCPNNTINGNLNVNGNLNFSGTSNTAGQRTATIRNFDIINVEAADQITVTCPNNIFNGNMSINGNLTVSGQVTAPTFNGNLNGNANTATTLE